MTNKYKFGFIVLPDRLKLPILFGAGLIISVISNFICKGEYTEREINYAYFAITSIFTERLDASQAFSALIFSISNHLIFIAILGVSAITVFSRSALFAAVLIKGFTLGRFCGCLISVSSPLEAFSAIIFSVAVNVFIISYAETAVNLSDSLRSKSRASELSILFSDEFISSSNKFLVTFGSIILLSIIKSFLLWLCSLV